MATLSRIITSSVVTGSLLVLASSPVLAVKFPDREYVPAGLTAVVHLRVASGCDGAPTDALQVSIPDSLSGVVAEAIPGWTVETDTVAMDPDSDSDSDPKERVSTIRWTGGTLPDGQFVDFGFRARFPDEVGAVLTFPVIQTCGSVQLDWTESEGRLTAPTIRLDQPVTQVDLANAIASIDALSADVARLEERLGAVNVTGIRNRLEDVEAAVQELAQ